MESAARPTGAVPQRESGSSAAGGPNVKIYETVKYFLFKLITIIIMEL